jgi:hypothetical protein
MAKSSSSTSSTARLISDSRKKQDIPAQKAQAGIIHTDDKTAKKLSPRHSYE